VGQVGLVGQDNWSTQFEQFVDRKTREALAAELHPYDSEVEAPSGGEARLGNAWTRQLFDGDFYFSPPSDRRRPACSLVFVQSRDGNTGARDPSSLGGGDTDKHLIYEGLSRVASDAVVAGAETIRGGDVVFSVWHPELVGLRASLGKPRHPMQVLATLRGLDFEHTLLLNVPEIPVALLTVAPCITLMQDELASRPWITTIVMDRPEELPGAFERLRAMGVRQMSCVGGRHVATQLIDHGLVQDVYLTTSPIRGGEPNTPMYPTRPAGRLVARKHGSADEKGVVFEHLRV